MQSVLEEKETKPISSVSRSYRQFLDEKAPGDVLLSKRFYEIVDSSSGSLYSGKLFDCRRIAWFIRHQVTGRIRLATKQCRLRWCYHCANARQMFITQAASAWFNHIYDPKLLTVTIRHSKKPLPEQIDFLYKSFQKLRSRKLFKTKVRGGLWFFQITYNSETGEWHPHIHALIDADYISHHYLIHVWEKITNGSTIVHIRRVDCPERTLSHNARYAARPSSLRTIPESLWGTLHDSFSGRRICGTWGTAKSISLRPKKPEDAENWKPIGGWETVRALMEFDDAAKKIWRSWTMDEELAEGITMIDVDDFLVDKKPEPPPKQYDWDINPSFDWEEPK